MALKLKHTHMLPVLCFLLVYAIHSGGALPLLLSEEKFAILLFPWRSSFFVEFAALLSRQQNE
jgi:hypothetical protein